MYLYRRVASCWNVTLYIQHTTTLWQGAKKTQTSCSITPFNVLCAMLQYHVDTQTPHIDIYEYIAFLLASYH